MLALITNDDGIESDGLRTLADAAVAAGLEVLVAAPFENSSGGSCSIIAVEDKGKVVTRRRPELGLPSEHVHSVAAMPALITLMALQGTFGPVPDVVLSGVNDGYNVGRAVVHSGTIGAAATAAAHGRPAIAFSLGAGEPRHLATAQAVATEVIAWSLGAGEVKPLSVNVPNVALEDVAGIRPARLAAFGAVQATALSSGEGSISLTYEEVERELEPGTDAALVAARFATVTALDVIAEAPLRNVASLLDRFAAPLRGPVGAAAR